MISLQLYFTQEKLKITAKTLPLETLKNEVYCCFYKARNIENQLKGQTIEENCFD